ncbi:MAG: CRISPR-associated ring nuclease, partial [Chloroflexi bacterium]|nr:CRISPR-associated ring nuclease [Chloroflexota bacterium]
MQPLNITSLIATLGSEPQVVTAALDLLAAQGETIPLVQVIHTQAAEGEIAAGLERLRDAFAAPPYLGSVALELYPLLDDNGAPFSDVETPQAAEQVFRLLYSVVRRAKQAGWRVHLSIAGGRKSMAVFGMTVAQMLFDEGDRLWHLHSSGEFLRSKRLHPLPGDQARLLAIPVILWSLVSPALLELGDVEDPFAAVERLRAL